MHKHCWAAIFPFGVWISSILVMFLLNFLMLYCSVLCYRNVVEIWRHAYVVFMFKEIREVYFWEYPHKNKLRGVGCGAGFSLWSVMDKEQSSIICILSKMLSFLSKNTAWRFNSSDWLIFLKINCIGCICTFRTVDRLLNLVSLSRLLCKDIILKEYRTPRYMSCWKDALLFTYDCRIHMIICQWTNR